MKDNHPEILFTGISPRLPTTDLPRTIAFYEDVLGFRADVLWPEVDPTFCLLRRGQISLAFDRVESSVALPDATGFYIEAADVRAMHQDLRGRVTVEWGPEVYQYGRREFAIRDPNGYMIIFTEHTDDPPTCAEN